MCAHVQKVIGAAFAEYISLDLGDFWLLFHNFWVLMMAVHLLTVILASLLLAHESAVLCPSFFVPRRYWCWWYSVYTL